MNAEDWWWPVREGGGGWSKGGKIGRVSAGARKGVRGTGGYSRGGNRR